MTHHSTSKLLLLAACLLFVLATLPKPSAAKVEADKDPSANEAEEDVRNVPCKEDKVKCSNGGKCILKVRWSKKNNVILERLESPKCECTSGHSGTNCEVKAAEKSKMTKSGTTALICGLSTVGALLLVLIGVVLYLGYLKRKTSGKQRRQQEQQQQQHQRASSAGSRSSAASHP